jgi:type II secretory pathway predicted ATPase ExeA
MSAQETRSYVEHRLRHVGWKDRPDIDDETFVRLHAHSGGIPRRINVICTRLLLACWLASGQRITPADLEQAVDELRAELGDTHSGAGASG